jgi:hypothetical protein
VPGTNISLPRSPYANQSADESNCFPNIQSGNISDFLLAGRGSGTLFWRVPRGMTFSLEESHIEAILPCACSFLVINRKRSVLTGASSLICTPCTGSQRCHAGLAARARSIAFAQVAGFSSWLLAVSAKPLAVAGPSFLRAGQNTKCAKPSRRAAPSLGRRPVRLPIAPMRPASLSCNDSPTRRCP